MWFVRDDDKEMMAQLFFDCATANSNNNVQLSDGYFFFLLFFVLRVSVSFTSLSSFNQVVVMLGRLTVEGDLCSEIFRWDDGWNVFGGQGSTAIRSDRMQASTLPCLRSI